MWLIKRIEVVSAILPLPDERSLNPKARPSLVRMFFWGEMWLAAVAMWTRLDLGTTNSLVPRKSRVEHLRLPTRIRPQTFLELHTCSSET